MEVIALEGAGDKRTPEHGRLRTNMKPRKALKHYPYFVDPAIVPRVKQYLEDNKDKVYVDIDDMVTELQRKYRDYAKRKRAAFKGMVEKAFSVVLKTYNMNSEDIHRDGDDSESSDVSGMDVDSEEVDLIVEPNASNNQVMNMYMQQQALKKLACTKQGAAPDGAKELIDISSDDDEEENPAKRTKSAEASNGNEAIVPPSADAPPSIDTNGQATPQEVGVAQDKSPATTPVATPPAVPAATPPVVCERPKRKRTTVESEGNGPSSSLHGDVPRKRRREVPVVRPCCSFKDVGGSSAVLQEVCKLLIHLRHPEIFEQIGVSPPRGFLLHGPPGCGKTLLANAIAGELGFPLVKVAAPELVAGVSGESEERIRDLFDQAVSLAPCVLFLDEIDAITPNRNNAQREMERRIVAQLLITLDELSEKEGGNQVLVVGATNRPDSLDPALRRAGRFDREVCMGIPDKEARAHILRVVCGRLALSPDVSSDAGFDELASLTPGFVGADLTALTREAAMVAVNRALAQIQRSQTEDGINAESIVSETVSDDKAPKVRSEEEMPKVEELTIPQVVESIVTDDKQSMDTTEVADISKVTDGHVASAPEASEAVDSEGHTTQTNEIKDEAAADSVEEKVVEASVVQSSANENKEEGNDHGITSDKIADSGVKENISHQTANGCPPSATEDVEVVSQSVNHEEIMETEAPQNVTQKTDNDVEVLEEVKMVNASNQLTESSSSGNDNSAIEKVNQKDLVLSQKLLPSTIWSSELCQLMSWLRDVPPMTSAQLSDLTITMADFHDALRHVQPSSKREGFVTVPDVTWDDIGSLKNVRAELQLCVLAPVRYAKQFSQLGLNAPAGVLLCGPPGCGKTLLAKAVANEAGINFISVKGPELLNMYVGESERAVRQVFQRARNSAPCVIFFDELDALCPRRSDSGDNGVSSRVVNQLLTEMDGVEGRAAVFLMAASNRPDIIDPAVLRPGRLDKIVYVGMPNAEDRKDILRALTKSGTRPLLSSDVDIAALASRPQFEGYSGADVASLVREAGVQALQEFIGSGGDPPTEPLSVALRHFNAAAMKIRPSVTGKARKHYEKLQELYCSPTMDHKSEVTETNSGS